MKFLEEKVEIVLLGMGLSKDLLDMTHKEQATE